MGEMVDVWPSIIEDDRDREMRFKMRRWKKSTEKANILQKEKDQVKTNFKVILAAFPKKEERTIQFRGAFKNILADFVR